MNLVGVDLGLVLRKLGQLDASAEHLRKAIELEPGDAWHP
jgi:hypothetical protein